MATAPAKAATPIAKETRVTITFLPGEREVKIDMPSLLYVSPRKIEHANNLLLKKFRETMGELHRQERQRELQADKDAAAKAAAAKAEEEKKLEAKRLEDQEKAELAEFHRLQKKFDTAKSNTPPTKPSDPSKSVEPAKTDVPAK